MCACCSTIMLHRFTAASTRIMTRHPILPASTISRLQALPFPDLIISSLKTSTHILSILFHENVPFSCSRLLCSCLSAFGLQTQSQNHLQPLYNQEEPRSPWLRNATEIICTGIYIYLYLSYPIYAVFYCLGRRINFLPLYEQFTQPSLSCRKSPLSLNIFHYTRRGYLTMYINLSTVDWGSPLVVLQIWWSCPSCRCQPNFNTGNYPPTLSPLVQTD